MKLSDLAQILSGELEGDGDVEITDIAKIDSAGKSDITFISNPVYEKFFSSTEAAAVIVSKDFNPESRPHIEGRKIPLIKVDDPYLSFIRLLDLFRPKSELQKIGIHETAVISETAEISSEEVRIGANVFIGEKVIIGKRTSILPNTVILAGVRIGDDCLIYPSVTIYPGCKIGNRVIIHSSTVIGSDGFGQARNQDGTFEKIPQRGIVVIGDDSEIGSGCTID
ncbi:MAG: UDP-3-O-(3-hydroxymyristoyl)glucosamine N-acyltransferase, partial [Ignavibacteria bacterium]|nr:UDP-3-O-(3-hydroxymyristoyl)glucosamine N-acyltransferase [Ignavibacteria bacterium]